MSECQGAHTVLIVDDDLGFVWWLGETFTEIGYRAIPALNPSQASEFLTKLREEINLLVVNGSIAGVGRLVKSLAGSQPDLKVILIQDGRTSKTPSFGYKASLTRPSSWEAVSREDWLRKLRSLLKQLEAAPPR